MAQTVNAASVALVAVPGNVPLKHRSNCPSAKAFYAQLKQTERFDHLVSAVMKKYELAGTAQAELLVDAWLQWYAVGGTTVTKQFVMLEGMVDAVFHQAILHTTWYFEFCLRTTGVYTHHDPLQPEDMIGDRAREIELAVEKTVSLLATTFGDELNPVLKSWVEQAQSGCVSITSVSCVGNSSDYQIVRNGA